MELLIQYSDLVKLAVKYQHLIGTMATITNQLALRELGREFVFFMRWSLFRARASGELDQSIKVISQTPDSVTIGPTAPHAKYVRSGTAPGTWPPTWKILFWVQAKGLIPITSPFPTQKARFDAQMAMTKKIQASIWREGTSVWAKGAYGTMENPFPERVLDDPRARQMVEMVALKLGRGIAARLA
jgi:hypothetical protein